MVNKSIEQKINELVNDLKELKRIRNEEVRPPPRKNPTKSMREKIILKTDRKCHICGGDLDEKWHADHVLPHASGGQDTEDNFLGSCSVCNGVRWYFSPDEIKLILKFGRMAQAEIRNNSALGRAIAEKYFIEEQQREIRREKRKKSRNSPL